MAGFHVFDISQMHVQLPECIMCDTDTTQEVVKIIEWILATSSTATANSTVELGTRATFWCNTTISRSSDLPVIPTTAQRLTGRNPKMQGDLCILRPSGNSSSEKIQRLLIFLQRTCREICAALYIYTNERLQRHAISCLLVQQCRVAGKAPSPQIMCTPSDSVQISFSRASFLCWQDSYTCWSEEGHAHQWQLRNLGQESKKM
jgi:hypothetical protein